MYNMVLLGLGVLVSILMGLSSSSFYMFWCMLELNSMWFLGMLWLDKQEGSGLSLIKYFLIQGVSSILLIWGVFIMNDLIMVISGLLKLGVFPFHIWSLDLATNSSWWVWLLLMSAQKLLPLWFLSKMNMSMGLMIPLALCNMVISCLGSLKKSSMKSLMFYSSLFNLSLILCLLESSLSSMALFILYCLVLLPCWSCLFKVEVSFMQQMKLSSGSLLSFLSLGGFPPSIGFFFKWKLISGLVISNVPMLFVTIMVILSLFMFYIYLSIIISSLLKKGLMMVSSHQPQEMVGVIWHLALVAPCMFYF